MAWGKQKSPPVERAAFIKLLPLFILIVALLGFAFVGYHIYISMQKISAVASDKMHKKNVVLTKDGMKVGVKELKTESYVDTTQGFLVKAWNLSSWPGYKSRLWNQDAEVNKAQSRKPFSRHSSAASTK